MLLTDKQPNWQTHLQTNRDENITFGGGNKGILKECFRLCDRLPFWCFVPLINHLRTSMLVHFGKAIPDELVCKFHIEENRLCLSLYTYELYI